MSDNKALLIGISGVSSSGKTTLARLLRDIFPRSFILHEDDFYKNDAEMPIHHGVADWDCLDSLNLPAFRKALTYIIEHGMSPPDLTSKEDKNTIGRVQVDETVLDDLKWKASKWMFADAPPIAIIDGFLLFSQDMNSIRELFDVKMLLRADYQTMKRRREARSGYVTLEGFWEDPPGYVDKIVWPNYVKEHSFLFKDGDVESEHDMEKLRHFNIKAMPASAQGDMTACLNWAYNVLDEALDLYLERKR